MLHIQAEDIALNQQGHVSPSQERSYSDLMARSKQGLRRYLVVMPVLLALGLGREVINGTNLFAGIRLNNPDLLITATMMVIYLGAMVFFATRGSSSLGKQPVKMAEGLANLSVIGMGNYADRSLLALMGLEQMRGRLQIGGKTFYVNEGMLRAFKPGATYRAYYVNRVTLPMLIGAEALADAA